VETNVLKLELDLGIDRGSTRTQAQIYSNQSDFNDSVLLKNTENILILMKKYILKIPKYAKSTLIIITII
jgi:hypothetical protein